MDQNFEDKQIKGVTFKAAAWMLGALLGGMLTCMAYITSIKSSIQEVSVNVNMLVEKANGNSKLYDLQLQYMKDRIIDMERKVNAYQSLHP